MKNVADILKHKGNEVYKISSEATVFEALELMAQKEIGALLVMDGENPVGILSERDYARKVILKGKLSKDLSVREIMNSELLFVIPARSIEECMALMINKRIRHLPVLDNGKLAGIISMGDVVKATIDEQEFIIDQLVHYITDSPAFDIESLKQQDGTIEPPPGVYRDK